MKIKSLFCMSGCGYLQAITQKSKEFIALFAIVDNDTLEPKKDCVVMEVKVEDKGQQRLLVNLLNSVENGHTVIVQFTSEYLMLVNTASGITPEDPQTIVTLKVKLLQVERCFINGQVRMVNKPQLYAVA